MAKPTNTTKPHAVTPPSGTAEHAVHEDLCTQCGKCCYKKIIVGSTVLITPFPCEFLNTDTNLCTIYDRRHELNPECLAIEEGLKHGAFPADCGYVPSMAPENYIPAIDTWDWKGEWLDFDSLADDLDVSEAAREKVRERGPYAPPMWIDAQARIKAAKEGLSEAALAKPQPTATEPVAPNRVAPPKFDPLRTSLWGDKHAFVDMSRPAPATEAAPKLADMARGKPPVRKAGESA